MPETASTIQDALLNWFSEHGRQFPWRATFKRPDPYLILFTEVMLLRTKAGQVTPVYDEFVRRYPTFKKLARASNRDILRLFSTLGLKWRARKIISLIRYLERHCKGVVPNDLAHLRELPGVGNYVAKAVLCYGFGRREGPVDSNVVRVVSRLLGLQVNPDTARRSKLIVGIADSLVPKGKNAQAYNLALLDLGALVCRPKPICYKCPLTSFCGYYRANPALSKSA